jgi:hypothetical protein
VFIAELVLIPAESKYLIAKAILQLETVRTALEKGLVVTHPSSTAAAIVEEITGEQPPRIWVAGAVRPRGFCVGYERQVEAKKGSTPAGIEPSKNTSTWVFDKGNLRLGLELGGVLERMGPQDVYIKGCNAVDPWRNAGVLYGKRGGGTIGLVLAARKKRQFNLILAAGLEKLIPVTIDEAAQAVPYPQVGWSMGLRAGLIPVGGQAITEVQAIEILFGVRATPIASGGLGGAEGCVSLAIQGEEAKVRAALVFILDKVKGRQGPAVYETECLDCPWTECNSALIYRETAATTE